jgi:flavin-binding protein dodecin
LGVWAVANFPPGFELIEVIASSPDTINQAVDRALRETVQPVETVQVWPLRYPLTQINVSATRHYRELIESGQPLVVQRMTTSQPEDDARWGWPL